MSMLGTAKAARWLNVPERTVREWCATGKLAGAHQWSGYLGSWLIPVTTLETLRSRPADISLLADLAETAEK
jgi:hypothetical protein